MSSSSTSLLFQSSLTASFSASQPTQVPLSELLTSWSDSTFIEDVALLTRNFAIIMKPGVSSRRGETTEIKRILRDYYNNIEEVQDPGTIEGGDIMMVGSHFYIGLSKRTNENFNE